MKTALAAISLVVLSACGATSVPMGGEGKYFVSCDEPGQRLEDCFIEANRICPAGYDVLDRSDKGSDLNQVSRNVSGEKSLNISVQCK